MILIEDSLPQKELLPSNSTIVFKFEYPESSFKSSKAEKIRINTVNSCLQKMLELKEGINMFVQL